MEWTTNPEFAAAAAGVARSVPCRVVAIAFLDGRSRTALVECSDDEPTLTGEELGDGYPVGVA